MHLRMCVEKSPSGEIGFPLPPGTSLKEKNSLPLGANFFPLREVPI